jgi:hypothetical protein
MDVISAAITGGFFALGLFFAGFVAGVAHHEMYQAKEEPS